MMRTFWRAVVEVGFIIFLFYSNLLMGEFERSAPGRQRGFEWALSDVFTKSNLAIAVIAAGIGYLAVELIRSRLWSDDNPHATGLFSKATLQKDRIAQQSKTK
jgi:hypothetical protein